MKNITENEITEELGNKKTKITKCPCPKRSCKNHGDCYNCQKRYNERKGVPYCFRKLGFFSKVLNWNRYQLVQEMKNQRKCALDIDEIKIHGANKK